MEGRTVWYRNAVFLQGFLNFKKGEQFSVIAVNWQDGEIVAFNSSMEVVKAVYFSPSQHTLGVEIGKFVTQ